MDVWSEYKQKLRTPDQAVQLVKSGDWVDYGTAVGFPSLLDAALARTAVPGPPPGPAPGCKNPGQPDFRPHPDR